MDKIEATCSTLATLFKKVFRILINQNNTNDHIFNIKLINITSTLLIFWPDNTCTPRPVNTETII